MQKQYGKDRLQKFAAVRKQHDPENFFINKWFSQVFEIDGNQSA